MKFNRPVLNLLSLLENYNNDTARTDDISFDCNYFAFDRNFWNRVIQFCE